MDEGCAPSSGSGSSDGTVSKVMQPTSKKHEISSRWSPPILQREGSGECSKVGSDEAKEKLSRETTAKT